MKINLRHIDELFHDASHQYEEVLPEGLWERIDAKLDKEKADSYKKKHIFWKRISVILFLFIPGYVLYESTVVKNNPHQSFKNKPQPSIAQESQLKTKVNNPNPIVLLNQDKSANLTQQDLNHLGNIQTGIILAGKFIQKQNYLRNKTAYQQISIFRKEAETKPINYLYLTEYQQNKTNFDIDRYVNFLNQIPPATINEAATGVKNQIKKASDKIKRDWSVTGFASYDWSQYRLDNDAPKPNEDKNIEEKETHQPSYSLGITTTWQFGKRWALQSGLIYSNTSIAIDPKKIYAVQQPDGNISYKYIISTGYAYVKPGFVTPSGTTNALTLNSTAIGDSISTANAEHHIVYFSVPFLIKYKIISQKVSFAPAAGIAFNFLTSAKVKTEVENAFARESIFINQLEGTRAIYLSLVAEAGLQYQLSGNFSVNLLPTFKYAISPITKNNIVKTYPYSFGAGLGLSYRF